MHILLRRGVERGKEPVAAEAGHWPASPERALAEWSGGVEEGGREGTRLSALARQTNVNHALSNLDQ